MRFADSFRAARWVRLINLLLQAVLFLALFAGLNYVALQHTWRFDLTRRHRLTLSAESRSYLENLQQPVRIVVTLTDSSDNTDMVQAAYGDIRALLREYAYIARNNEKGKIEVEYLDIYQNRKKAEDLGIDAPNVVVLISRDHRRVLTMGDFYVTKRAGQQLTREAFLGESAMTAAILEVSSPEKKKIYFVLGHGELNPDDVGPRGMSLLADELRQRNFALDGVDLNQTRKVPEDAALLIIAGMQGPYDRFEQELLRNYLQTRAGRVILMLEPARNHGLKNLLFDWGVLDYDNVIYDPDPKSRDESGNLRFWRYMPHPITQSLVNNSLYVTADMSTVVSEDLGRSTDDGLTVKTLMATSPDAWGETSYRLRISPTYDAGIDLKSRNGLGVFVISERVKPANLPSSVRGGRLAVFGTADIVTNNRITNPANATLFLATVNWCVDRDTQLSIPARPVERFQLSLSQADLGRLRLGLLLIVPGAVAVLGIIVYWTRRN
ncbi:MAG TPA: GldG family protein [Candidatus Didemnitutus sp.]|nr:GldG family protein [Candidatus Didemnitutus sp.]